MATTIKQIAERAGVSPATVSLVINMRPGIGSATRDRVLAAASDLGYRPKKGPAAAPTRAIRFLQIVRHGHILNPNHRVFIADYIEGIEREARIWSCSLEVSSHEGFNPAEILASLESGSIGGAIVLGTELDESDIEALRDAGRPLVFMDTFHSSLGFDFVDMDNDSSVFAVVEYLWNQGHRRIGLVKGSIPTRNFRLRERSFFESLDHFGLSFDPDDSFAVDSTYDKGRLDMSRLLAERHSLPTALFCLNDIIAYGCANALQAAGVAIPEEVSLIGFDDLPSNMFMSPPLSSVRVSKHRIGQRAMQLMAQRLEDPLKCTEKILVGGELVLRGSVCPSGAGKGSAS